MKSYQEKWNIIWVLQFNDEIIAAFKVCNFYFHSQGEGKVLMNFLITNSLHIIMINWLLVFHHKFPPLIC